MPPQRERLPYPHGLDADRVVAVPRPRELVDLDLEGDEEGLRAEVEQPLVEKVVERRLEIVPARFHHLMERGITKVT